MVSIVYTVRPLAVSHNSYELQPRPS